MNVPKSFEEFQRQCRGPICWHGPQTQLHNPPMPEPGLSFLGRVRWHIREYLRPKTKEERFLIKLAKKQWD
jgi:hypothetical protein